MHLSVILPTFNEANNIITLIEAIMAQIPQGIEYEIILVDDNSPDGTYALAQRTFGNHPQVRTMLRTADRGLANSIRAGIETSHGKHIIIMDTDFTHNPKEIPNLLHIAKLYDIVSGSRFCPGGLMQNTSHYLCSLAFNWLVRIVLRTQIQDNTGGFFIIRREKLFSLPIDNIFFGYGDYYFRLLHYAQKKNLSIVEIPAKYLARSKGQSKSNFFRMFFDYTMAMLRMKWHIFRNPV